MPTLNDEALRQKCVAGVDSILDAPWIVRKMLSADSIQLLKAQRRYWQETDSVQLGTLNNFYEQEQHLLHAAPPAGVVYNAPVPPQYKTGLIPRDRSLHPSGCFDFATKFPNELLLPESEWAPRLAQQQATKSSLLDLRNDNYEVLKSYDQNGYGLCWAFSSTKAATYLRVLQGQTPIRLSAYYVAGKVKNWRDEGGWGSESLEFISKYGAPEASLCPQYKSSYATSDVESNAAKHKVTEWWDGADDRATTKKQLITCLLLGIPCVVDLNWMGHSMCCIAIESLNPLSVVFDNSWGEQGDRGLYRAQGDKAIPDNITMPRVVMAS